jgi:hypothetical protein
MCFLKCGWKRREREDKKRSLDNPSWMEQEMEILNSLHQPFKVANLCQSDSCKQIGNPESKKQLTFVLPLIIQN